MQNSNVSNNTILGGARVERGKGRRDSYNTILRAFAWGEEKGRGDGSDIIQIGS